MFRLTVLLALGWWSAAALTAQARLVVDVDAPRFTVSPTMYGIFFEDINFAADGGLYAELVKNRSFEFDQPLMGWRIDRAGANAGAVLIQNEQRAHPNNPRYATVEVNGAPGDFVLRNAGFRGMGVHGGEAYDFSVLARRVKGAPELEVALVDSTGQTIGSTRVDLTAATGRDFVRVGDSLTATATDAHAELELRFSGRGSVEVDMISLFPRKTWKDRPGGLRRDLVELLDSLQPGFVRFPGGCIVEGRDLANRYQWKSTVGDVADRRLIVNRWNTEFAAPRNAPDYYQSYGLGFYEYFLLSEDLGAEPLPILNCGMACQYNTAEVVPLDDLDPYIQDALDLIEFANGGPDTEWGALRAEMGHPEPFAMKFLGVGNEQWGPQFVERYAAFQEVLAEAHPEITLVSTVGPAPDGEEFDFLWQEMKKMDAELIDEHYYRPPEWFLANAGRYDDYDRDGPAVFAGEYASHGPDGAAPESRNTWLSALTEAAFMTGLERNGDVVRLTSYAPLMAHAEAWQWRPDLIWFNNLNVGPTPNYHVQRLFSNNPGTHGLPALVEGAPLTGQDSLYASAVLDSVEQTVIVKIVNVSDAPQDLLLELDGKRRRTGGTWTTLSATELLTYNRIADERIRPETTTLERERRERLLTLPPQSVNVYRLPLR